jgi:hypothetical protein
MIGEQMSRRKALRASCGGIGVEAAKRDFRLGQTGDASAVLQAFVFS